MFEDEIARAFIDLFPQGEGHTRVILKGEEARNFLDLPEAFIGGYSIDAHPRKMAPEDSV